MKSQDLQRSSFIKRNLLGWVEVKVEVTSSDLSRSNYKILNFYKSEYLLHIDCMRQML